MRLPRNPFRRRPDPTRNWREELGVPLVADLDRLELSGVGVGREVDDLSFLGPSPSAPLEYPHKGLLIDVEDGVFTSFVVALRGGVYLGSVDPARVHAFAGRIRIGGRDLAPANLTAESDFTGSWGEPYWRDRDEDEVLLFFELATHEIQVELSLEGVPLVVVACSPPLMADPEQRRRYGVTREWPPRSDEA